MHPSSEPKVILFPAPHLGTQTADVGRPRLEDKEQLQDLSILRVSVLDLDNSVRFSRDTKETTEETVVNIASPEGDQLRSAPYLGRSNSVDCHSQDLSLQSCLRTTCISLNDVNVSEETTSDWTVKNCVQCLTIKSMDNGGA